MEKTASTSGWIIAISSTQTTSIKWSSQDVDIPGLTDYDTYPIAPTDTQASCSNTEVITAYGNSSKYPAAWVAKNYKPSGTPSGKSWCLPSGGLLNDALNNQTNFNEINRGITIAGGKNIGTDSETVWSSSEYSNDDAWCFYANMMGAFYMTYSNKSGFNGYYSVRPVMEF